MLSRSEIDRSPSAPPPSPAPAPSSSSAEAPPPCPHRSTPIHCPPLSTTPHHHQGWRFFVWPFLFWHASPVNRRRQSRLTCQPRRRQAGSFVSLAITCQVCRRQAGSLVSFVITCQVRRRQAGSFQLSSLVKCAVAKPAHLSTAPSPSRLSYPASRSN